LSLKEKEPKRILRAQKIKGESPKGPKNSTEGREEGGLAEGAENMKRKEGVLGRYN